MKFLPPRLGSLLAPLGVHLRELGSERFRFLLLLLNSYNEASKRQKIQFKSNLMRTSNSILITVFLFGLNAMLSVTALQAQPPESQPTPTTEASPIPTSGEISEATPTPQPTSENVSSAETPFASETSTPAKPQSAMVTQTTPAPTVSDAPAAGESSDDELSIQLTYPSGNPTGSPAPASSEFTFSGSTPGTLVIQCRVQVTPNTAENRERVADKLRFTIEPIGTSHTSGDVTSIRWDVPWVVYSDGRSSRYGKGIYDASTGTFNATATFRGLPRNNSDFGQKNVKQDKLQQV